MGFKGFQFFIFISICILSSIAVQSIFYETIYHSDNLYLPLFAKDVMAGAFAHWYLPPSTYFFPDLLFMLLLWTILPETLLPVSYALLNFSLILLFMYQAMKCEIGKRKALFAINLFIGILTGSFVYQLLDSSHINPFVYLFTNGHHTSSLLSFLIISIYLNHRSKYKFFFWMIVVLLIILTYLSDRFFIIFLASFLFLVQRKRRTGSLIQLLTLIFLAELIHLILSENFHIPNGFPSLLNEFSLRDMQENTRLLLRYYFDFFKIYFTRISPFFQILFLQMIFVSLYIKIRKRHSSFLILVSLLSFLFLGIVGRFVFPNAFPFRYLFPFLFCLFFYSLIYVLKRASSFKPKLLEFSQVFVSGILLVSFTTYPLAEDIILEKATYRRDLLFYLKQTMGNESFWTSYEAEKKIRFWSGGQLQPLPCDTNGRPYLWITGAFQKQIPLPKSCPRAKDLSWFPNSLTKDF